MESENSPLEFKCFEASKEREKNGPKEFSMCREKRCALLKNPANMYAETLLRTEVLHTKTMSDRKQ